MHSHSDEPVVIDPQAMKELELLDSQIRDVDLEVTAKKHLMLASTLAQRQQTINKIPGFWAVVFENAIMELEASITPVDSEIFAHALTGVEVLRPEIPAGAKVTDSGLDAFGEPRSITVNFYFKENEWFSDSVLSKTLYFRYTKDGSSGLTSDPVPIAWKAGKDVTEGLSDATFQFWHAQRQAPSQQLDGVLTREARKARDAAAKETPQYKALAALIAEKVNGAMSFFNFFSYRGRWTSAAESNEVRAEIKARRAAALAGKEDDSDDEDEDEEDDEDGFAEEDVETFPLGHDIAVAIAEDVWPDAINYFLADSIDSDVEIDDDDDDESDDDDDDDEDVEME